MRPSAVPPHEPSVYRRAAPGGASGRTRPRPPPRQHQHRRRVPASTITAPPASSPPAPPPGEAAEQQSSSRHAAPPLNWQRPRLSSAMRHRTLLVRARVTSEPEPRGGPPLTLLRTWQCEHRWMAHGRAGRPPGARGQGQGPGGSFRCLLQSAVHAAGLLATSSAQCGGRGAQI